MNWCTVWPEILAGTYFGALIVEITVFGRIYFGDLVMLCHNG